MGNAGAFVKAVADVKNVAPDYNEFDAFRLMSGLRLLKPKSISLRIGAQRSPVVPLVR